MRTTTSIIATILLVFALLDLAGWTVAGQRQKVAQVSWEYKVITVGDTAEGEKTLNALGAQGWELLAVQPIPVETSKAIAGAYFLKRAK